MEARGSVAGVAVCGGINLVAAEGEPLLLPLYALCCRLVRQTTPLAQRLVKLSSWRRRGIITRLLVTVARVRILATDSLQPAKAEFKYVVGASNHFLIVDPEGRVEIPAGRTRSGEVVRPTRLLSIYLNGIEGFVRDLLPQVCTRIKATGDLFEEARSLVDLDLCTDLLETCLEMLKDTVGIVRQSLVVDGSAAKEQAAKKKKAEYHRAYRLQRIADGTHGKLLTAVAPVVAATCAAGASSPTAADRVQLSSSEDEMTPASPSPGDSEVEEVEEVAEATGVAWPVAEMRPIARTSPVTRFCMNCEMRERGWATVCGHAFCGPCLLEMRDDVCRAPGCHHYVSEVPLRLH